MLCRHYLFLMSSALLLLPNVARSEPASTKSLLPVRELWMQNSSDGRSHDIEAMALGRSGNADVLYVIERNAEPVPSKSKDIDQLLWKLDVSGKVLHKELIRKMPNREPSRPTIIPLPAPVQGAIVVGMFEDRYGWSFLRVDDAGEIVTSKSLAGDAFLGAVLSPNAKSVLLVGYLGKMAIVWATDLDGNVLWKATYEPKVATVENAYVAFTSIALVGHEGKFIAVGEVRETLNKFGLGKASIWLVRCDEVGAVLSETTFPGRNPSSCIVDEERLAILYDASFALQIDCRVRGMDMNCNKQWEKKAEFTSLWVDRPAISPIPTDQGFVLAGCNNIPDNRIARRECRFFQYDISGQVVSSMPIPITSEAFLMTRVVCAPDRAYVAIQTKGTTPKDAKEAGIFEIPLRK